MSATAAKHGSGPYSPTFIDIEYDEDDSAVAPPFTNFHGVQKGRPPPSGHIVARVWYPSGEAQAAPVKRSKSVPYLLHRQYAWGFAEFLTKHLKSWYSWTVKQSIACVIYCTGAREKLDVTPAEVPTDDISSFPVLVFSHGIGGNRFTYSHLHQRWASHGYVVMALEHTDGMGSGAKLAGKRGWMYYRGWGDHSYLEDCTRHRVTEAETAISLLQAVNKAGAAVPHLKGRLPKDGACKGVLDRLQGRLQADAVCMAGHSYGGATTIAVAARSPHVQCAVAYDPWYAAIPQDDPCHKAWLHPCPLLVVGSQAWNEAGNDGTFYCDGKFRGLQERVLSACAAIVPSDSASEAQVDIRVEEQGVRVAIRGAPCQRDPRQGAGAVLLVPKDSMHSMVDDVGAVFMSRYRWLTDIVSSSKGVADQAVSGLEMANRCADCALWFAIRHMPVCSEVLASLASALQQRWDVNVTSTTAVSSVSVGEAETLKQVLANGANAPGCFAVREYTHE